MGLKMKNIWKIFLSTALSASIAATNAFAVVTIKEGDINTDQLIIDLKAANPGREFHGNYPQPVARPFVNGKTVYNNYNRTDGGFDFIYGKANAADMGTIMTYAHTATCSSSFLTCICKETTNGKSKFYCPIGTSNEHTLIDAFVRSLHAKLSTPGTTDDDKKAYEYLLQLIQITKSHLWFLRCPGGYGTCQREHWVKKGLGHDDFPFFCKIGLEFVDMDGNVKTGNIRGKSQIPQRAFDSIKAPGTNLKNNVITALTISECAWESKVFEGDKNSLDTSLATQRMYDMLNETLYALLVYGLACLDPNGQQDPIATYNNYVYGMNQNRLYPPIQHPLLPAGITLNALATSLGDAIQAVKGYYQIGKGVLGIIKNRCAVEEKVDGRVKKWAEESLDVLVTGDRSVRPIPLPPPPAVQINFTPPPAKRPRVAASTVPNHISPIPQNNVPDCCYICFCTSDLPLELQ